MEPRIQYAQTEDGVSIAFWTNRNGAAGRRHSVVAEDSRQLSEKVEG